MKYGVKKNRLRTIVERSHPFFIMKSIKMLQRDVTSFKNPRKRIEAFSDMCSKDGVFMKSLGCFD